MICKQKRKRVKHLFENEIAFADEIQKFLQVSRPTFYKMIEEEVIRHHRLGRQYIFFWDEVLEDLKKM